MTASLKLHRKRYLNYPPNKKIYILTLSIIRQILTNQNCEVNIRSLNPSIESMSYQLTGRVDNCKEIFIELVNKIKVINYN